MGARFALPPSLVAACIHGISASAAAVFALGDRTALLLLSAFFPFAKFLFYYFVVDAPFWFSTSTFLSGSLCYLFIHFVPSRRMFCRSGVSQCGKVSSFSARVLVFMT